MGIAGYRYPDKPIETAPDVVAKLSPKLWLAQAKYDGWRLQTYFDGPGHVRCLTRMGRPMEQTRSGFNSEVGHLLKSMSLPTGTVLDAEFIGPRGHQEPAIYIFDMLAWDGEWLTREPYEKRWERCQGLALPDGPVHLAETVQDNFIAFFERFKADWYATGCGMHLWEGIVVKSRRGRMKLDRSSSQKSDTMFKLKFREIKAARF